MGGQLFFWGTQFSMQYWISQISFRHDVVKLRSDEKGREDSVSAAYREVNMIVLAVIV